MSSREDLVHRSRLGDQQALANLLQEHGPQVRARLRNRIPLQFQSLLSLDDVMQQTYTDAFLTIDQFNDEHDGAFQGWLLTLARCNLADALRMLNAQKRGKAFRRIHANPDDDSLVALFEYLGTATGTPSRVAARHEARSAILAALDHLPENYRQVVQLYDLEGQPIEAVTRAVGRSPGAVYMIRARALRRLRHHLGNVSRYLTSS